MGADKAVLLLILMEISLFDLGVLLVDEVEADYVVIVRAILLLQSHRDAFSICVLNLTSLLKGLIIANEMETHFEGIVAFEITQIVLRLQIL